MKGRCDFGPSTPLRVVLAVVLAACASVAWASGRRACVTSLVPEEFTLPDGSVHAAGRLTVCAVKALNPVVELQRVSVDGGGGGGLIASRRARAEATGDSRAVLLFLRVPGNPLDFVGYVFPDGRASWSYTLRLPNGTAYASSGTPGAARSTGKPDTLPSPDGERDSEPR
jgi:hypothetical protein